MSEREESKRMTKEKRKAQILAAAMKRFIKTGYHATTTASIAKEAGISEVTLFRYFPTKKELFREGIEPILSKSLERVILTVEEKDLNPTEKLKYIIKDRIEFAFENREMIKLILMERQINPDMIAFDYIENTLTLLEESAEEAGIELVNKEETLRVLIGSILSFLYFPETEMEKVSDYVDHLISLLKKEDC